MKKYDLNKDGNLNKNEAKAFFYDSLKILGREKELEDE